MVGQAGGPNRRLIQARREREPGQSPGWEALADGRG